jgi:hypothetical protein
VLGSWTSVGSMLIVLHCGSSGGSKDADGSGGGDAGALQVGGFAGSGAPDASLGGASFGGVAGTDAAAQAGAAGSGGTAGIGGVASEAGAGNASGAGGGGSAGAPSEECIPPAQQPDATSKLDFDVVAHYATGSSYVGIPFELADIDGDGLLDAVMALQSSGRIALLRGTPQGTFEARTEFVIAGVSLVNVYDVNADGDLDLVAYRSNQVVASFGNGDGTFQDPVVLIDGGVYGQFQFYDVMGDSHVDLIAARGNTSDIGIFTGDGSGAFTFAAALKPLAIPTRYAVADVNGDGKLDISAVVHWGTNDILQIALADGAGGFGTFSSHTLSTLLGATPGRILELLPGNLNGDVYQDLLLVDERGVNLLLGSGSGAPTLTERLGKSQVSGAALGDLDGDGALDIAFMSSDQAALTLLFGAGDGTFQASAEYTVGQSGSAVRMGDVDADGQLDVVVSTGSITIVRNHTGRRFDAAAVLRLGAQLGPSELADLDLDGQLDLVVLEGQSVLVALGDGLGGFEPALRHDLGVALVRLAVFDANGDATRDVAVITDADQLGLFLNTGTGSLQMPSALEPSGDRIDVADLNEDGSLDVLTSDYKYVHLHQNDGSGAFTRRTLYDQGSSFSRFATGKIDSDPHLDLAIAGYDTKNVTILRGAGDGSVAFDEAFSTASQAWTALPADFNGDCRTDLLVGLWTVTNSLVLYSRDTAGSFQGTAIGTNYGTDLITVDANSDGWLDAMLVHFGLNMCQLLRNVGGSFARELIPCPGGDAVSSGDLNRDGRPDFVVTHRSDGYLSILLSTPGG